MKAKWTELLKSADFSGFSSEALDDLMELIAPGQGGLSVPLLHRLPTRSDSASTADEVESITNLDLEEDFSDYEVFDF